MKDKNLEGVTNIMSTSWLESPLRQRAIDIAQGKRLSTEILECKLQPYNFQLRLWKYRFSLVFSKKSFSFRIAQVIPKTYFC